MIIKEYFMTRLDGIRLYKNYSSEGFYLIQDQTGYRYDVAIDVENSPYTYTETVEKIETSNN